MDNSQSASYRAGEAKGQAQEKGSQLMDKAANAANSAQQSLQEVINFTSRDMTNPIGLNI